MLRDRLSLSTSLGVLDDVASFTDVIVSSGPVKYVAHLTASKLNGQLGGVIAELDKGRMSTECWSARLARWCLIALPGLSSRIAGSNLLQEAPCATLISAATLCSSNLQQKVTLGNSCASPALKPAHGTELVGVSLYKSRMQKLE